ncbi:MAG: maltotransferase domain-containing protein, partial [Nocardioides sp.]
MVGRIPVMDVSPLADLGRQAAKATAGEPFPVSATVFREGHDKLGAEVVLADPAGRRRPPTRMARHESVPDLYEAWVTPDLEGAWTYEVHAWSDPVATWQHAAGLKIPAGVDVDLMFAEGRLLLEKVAADRSLDEEARAVVQGAIAAAQGTSRPVEARLAGLESPELREVLAAHPVRELVTVEGPHPVYADRPRALFGSWYEFFPRSEGATVDDSTGAVTSGTLATAARRLDAVAAMKFDVIYLPPVHPIGEVNRKGPNNTLDPGPGNPGSPWAIGSRYGGHDAIHPDLGTFDDFDAFVARAKELGLEVAIDLALQTAPDHPWVSTHPEWFTTQADGTIAYAENPPKKYQDIFPLNFDNDPAGAYAEVRRVVQVWIDHGVKIFRVDNPHTKPVAFWQWLIADVALEHPDVIWLAEAFTKPAMMHTLAKAGFQQSYTYYAWRNLRWELEEYLQELSGDAAAYMRLSFWPTTHDILTPYMQYGGPTAWMLRAALAATLVPTYGIYAGYELMENVARQGAEEQVDNEKYQYKDRRWEDYEEGGAKEGQSLSGFLTKLNAIRRSHPSLH